MIPVALVYIEEWTNVRTVNDVIAKIKISRIHGLPYALNYGAPRSSSAIKKVENVKKRGKGQTKNLPEKVPHMSSFPVHERSRVL